MSYEHELLDIINTEGMKNYTPSIHYAEVIGEYPNTRLKFQDFEIETEQIKYSAWVMYLINGFKTEIAGQHPHYHDVILSGLKVGEIAIIKYDGSTVTILDKVVS